MKHLCEYNINFFIKQFILQNFLQKNLTCFSEIASICWVKKRQRLEFLEPLPLSLKYARQRTFLPMFSRAAHAVHRAERHIFFLRGQAASDVPLGLVDLQHSARLVRKFRIDFCKAFSHVLMYGTLRYSEFFSCFSYGGVAVDNEIRNFYGSLLYVSFQEIALPTILFKQIYDGPGAVINLFSIFAFYSILVKNRT